jgi:FMN phosphatase YigB (HAD superfamily)
MKMPHYRVLHAGDSVVDDIEGARSAGIHAVLVRRDDSVPPAGTITIPGLDRLPEMLGLSGAINGPGNDYLAPT